MSKDVKKVVLAYSAGLDTSVILKWLKTEYACEVVTFTADLGQGEELEPARAKAQLLGIKPQNIFVEDLREEFVRDFVFPMFRANALYEGVYLLGTSIPMGHSVSAGQLRDLDLPLGDQGPGDGGAEQIDAFVERVRPEHGEDEVAHELLAQILDEDLLDAEHLGLLARGLELLALAEIGSEGHDLAGVGLLQPFQDDRGVEPAGISEHHL